MKDYIIVGLGIAGLCLSYELRKRNQTFTVIDNTTGSATRIAGGITNPLILKRFTKAWKADEFIPKAASFYQEIDHELKIKSFSPTSIYRKIKSVQEQNDWFVASDKPDLEAFMNPELQQISQLPSPFKYGEVQQASLLDTKKLLDHYRAYLDKRKQLLTETFDYTQLESTKNYVQYKTLKAKKIIFAEGKTLLQNPFFNYLPLVPNKGEYLIIHAPSLKLNHIIKTALALVPLGNSYYKFGASYSRDFTTELPEPEAKNFLIKKLEELLDCPYEIVEIQAGVRPTVLDRRPLLGRHPRYQRLLVCNGFGSHGLMMAPTMAKWLLDFDQLNQPLLKKVDIHRYKDYNGTPVV